MANIVDFIISFGSKGGNAVVRQAAQLQGRLDAADSSARRLSDTVGNNLRNAFMSLPGASFFMNPIVAISAGIGAVSKLGMQAQTTATSFEVLVGSQEKSSAMLDEINEYAKVSPAATTTACGSWLSSSDRSHRRASCRGRICCSSSTQDTTPCSTSPH